MLKNGVTYEPAAIIAADDDDDDHGAGHDDISLTSKPSPKKNKIFTSSKKKKSAKKQSYVMINEELSDDDDEEEEDEESDGEININDDYSKHTNGSMATNKTLQIAENSEDETEISDLEDIELNTSPIHHTTNIQITTTQNQKDRHCRYGTSAYFGLRLNYNHTKWHNIGWTIIFSLHCIAILIVLSLVWSSSKVSMPHAESGLFILLFLLAFAIIFSFAWTFMLRYCGGFIVWILIIANR